MAESLHILLGTSACPQWLCHSGERTVARGPLVLFYHNERIMGKSGNVVPCTYVSASSMDPNFIGKVICFLQIFLPALSIGPLVPPPPEYFVSAKNIACLRRFELKFESIRR